MLKKVQLLMLPTNQKARIGDLFLCNGLCNKPIRSEEFVNRINQDLSYWQPQHLYFLSDESIKEGDWYYTIDTRDILKCTKIDEYIHSNSKQSPKHLCKKIIATTDTTLEIGINQCDGCNANLPLEKGIHKDHQVFGIACTKNRYVTKLPQPSQSFLEKYVKAYNEGKPITKVMVEYCYSYRKNSDGNNIGFPVHEPTILKINSKDNTITIKPIKDSWTREEVKQLIYKFATKCLNEKFDICTQTTQWIEENL